MKVTEEQLKIELALEKAVKILEDTYQYMDSYEAQSIQRIVRAINMQRSIYEVKEDSHEDRKL